MNEYEVELACFSFGNFCKEEVLADKYPLLMVFCKESLCFFNALLADVYSCHLTAFFCEGKQVLLQCASGRCLFLSLDSLFLRREAGYLPRHSRFPRYGYQVKA